MKRFASLAILLAAAVAVPASTVLEVGLDRLSKSAARVVSGEILSITPERGENGIIYSDVVLQVSRAIPQQLVGRPMKLRMVGGEMDGQRVYVQGMPKFEVGDDVVLFLNRETSSVMGPTVGLWQGVFYLGHDKTTGQELVLDHQRRPVLGLAADNGVMRGAEIPEGVSLKSLSLGGDRSPWGADRFFDRIRTFRASGPVAAK